MPTGESTRERVNGSPADTPTEPQDYAALNAVFAALLAGVVLAARERNREREPLTSHELAVTGAATFALAKVIARERIGTWVREPFVDEDDGRRPRGTRLRHAVGELLTCTRCVGAWSALAVVGLRVAEPGAGRTVANVLAASAANDWLQLGFKLAAAHTNRAEAAQR